jgi:hypothetical protein
MKLRKIVFWPHLTAGVVAGTVILVTSVTGGSARFLRTCEQTGYRPWRQGAAFTTGELWR